MLGKYVQLSYTYTGTNTDTDILTFTTYRIFVFHDTIRRYKLPDRWHPYHLGQKPSQISHSLFSFRVIDGRPSLRSWTFRI